MNEFENAPQAGDDGDPRANDEHEGTEFRAGAPGVKAPPPAKLPTVDSPPAEDVLSDAPSQEEIIADARSAEEIVNEQPSVDELLGEERSLGGREALEDEPDG
jgi:hypothetical protein